MADHSTERDPVPLGGGADADDDDDDDEEEVDVPAEELVPQITEEHQKAVDHEASFDHVVSVFFEQDRVVGPPLFDVVLHIVHCSPLSGRPCPRSL